MEWQPIETAPKDGTVILLGDEAEGTSTCGRWIDGGFYELNEQRHMPEMFGDLEPLRPTHWAPMPDIALKI